MPRPIKYAVLCGAAYTGFVNHFATWTQYMTLFALAGTLGLVIAGLSVAGETLRAPPTKSEIMLLRVSYAIALPLSTAATLAWGGVHRLAGVVAVDVLNGWLLSAIGIQIMFAVMRATGANRRLEEMRGAAEGA